MKSAHDILELLHRRRRKSSTIFCSLEIEYYGVMFLRSFICLKIAEKSDCS